VPASQHAQDDDEEDDVEDFLFRECNEWQYVSRASMYDIEVRGKIFPIFYNFFFLWVSL
jgi:hypothetical protein